MSLVLFNLSARVTPAQATAALEGLRFKTGERRLKRYVRGDKMAEAVYQGPLSVTTYEQHAALGDAMLVGRRRLTSADFPWTTHMDRESILMQHTTFVTHRVSLVCETGRAPEDASVRIEWDFSSAGKRGIKQDDHAERVDWVLDKLAFRAVDGATVPGAELTLKRLLRIRQKQCHGQECGTITPSAVAAPDGDVAPDGDEPLDGDETPDGDAALTSAPDGTSGFVRHGQIEDAYY